MDDVLQALAEQMIVPLEKERVELVAWLEAGNGVTAPTVVLGAVYARLGELHREIIDLRYPGGSRL
ncbi:MAG: hypothetical protein JSR19_01385 [Proteobacteria bacterium]|nr:hypothetical protein [Pseudomonadota bacterium]HQR02502.1 hypothetical protein [Rhodocyclaceae bacterium]